MTQITYELQARQQTSLTPRLQQSVKLLQMSTLDFSREVAEAIANNPFLEEPEDPVASDEKSGLADHGFEDTPSLMDNEVAADPAQYVDADNGQDVTPPETEYLASSLTDAPAYSGDYPTQRNSDRPDSDVGQWARSTGSLQESLRADLCSYHLSERERYLTEFIIEALDDDGYLRVPFSELASAQEFTPPVSNDEWEIALRLVQQLGQPGLAARNLPECLTLQLNALPDHEPGKAMALRIVDEAIERLGRCDYAGLAKALSCTEETIQEACMLIRTLSPRPGGQYSAVDPSCYVIPDAIVRKVGRLWVATSNEEATPRACLNNAYAQLFRQSRYGDRSLMAQALQEARWLMRSLEQRKSTIQLVAQAIVARQQTFFDYGEIALRPMMLSEIADELGMHESTISRATSNKYLASPRGIYEFKSFFSRELATQSGGTCSAVAVRALIQEMIDAEDPKEPLSDVVLARKLAREGVVVARRTVSKYRAQIKCPPADLRRRPSYS
ncbi:RNA polymerase factor sigma-54 [Pollutimonas nitritireducens]|uniref:RNA polymerase sigma-54 factor n=1 Tax=Pollutimonas nitritireducens TaxID=2045209 RepID=A0A2N4UHQ3_9BURK|nr:RNA polymerase factor sigma-54 [Pollutimonas nitritireducens]PLC54556.1 RNA polymerase factor sigma-54 [Pollutimonas nitritireducens]